MTDSQKLLEIGKENLDVFSLLSSIFPHPGIVQEGGSRIGCNPRFILKISRRILRILEFGEDLNSFSTVLTSNWNLVLKLLEIFTSNGKHGSEEIANQSIRFSVYLTAYNWSLLPDLAPLEGRAQILALEPIESMTTRCCIPCTIDESIDFIQTWILQTEEG